MAGSKKPRSGGTKKDAKAREKKDSKTTGAEKFGKDAADGFMDSSDVDVDGDSGDGLRQDEVEVFAPSARDGDGEEWEDAAGTHESSAPQPEKVSKGWRKDDFYGGSDDDEAGSDEDLVFEEARRLEELRATRLAKGGDILSQLTAPLAETSDQSVQPVEEQEKGQAEFESVFAAAAEKVAIERDLSTLSVTQKRSIMAKEAPELQPLLKDFEEKLHAYNELKPLLEAKALQQLSPSGQSFVQEHATLLLSTLTNLSYYVLLKAEGGVVREHPVVTQLVWLRELHEKIEPLRKRLAPELRKAAKSAKSEKAAAKTPVWEGAPTELEPKKSAVTLPTAKKRLTLRERLEKAKLAGTNAEASAQAKKTVSNTFSFSTEDLFRAPKKKRKNKNSSATEVPDDLDDVDPMLGIWAPKGSATEQASEVQRHIGAQSRKENEVAASGNAEINVMAKPRQKRERMSESIEENVVQDSQGQEEEDEFAAAMRRNSSDKKKSKDEQQAARIAEKAKSQFKPEEELEGRRKTSKKILDNRGLVRPRKKQAGNARVNNRSKFEKAVKRRKGAVQDIQYGASDGATYHGEATGVRTHIAKGHKFKS